VDVGGLGLDRGDLSLSFRRLLDLGHLLTLNRRSRTVRRGKEDEGQLKAHRNDT